jgi:hypothetical protein
MTWNAGSATLATCFRFQVALELDVSHPCTINQREEWLIGILEASVVYTEDSPLKADQY